MLLCVWWQFIFCIKLRQTFAICLIFVQSFPVFEELEGIRFLSIQIATSFFVVVVETSNETKWRKENQSKVLCDVAALKKANDFLCGINCFYVSMFDGFLIWSCCSSRSRFTVISSSCHIMSCQCTGWFPILSLYFAFINVSTAESTFSIKINLNDIYLLKHENWIMNLKHCIIMKRSCRKGKTVCQYNVKTRWIAADTHHISNRTLIMFASIVDGNQLYDKCWALFQFS